MTVSMLEIIKSRLASLSNRYTEVDYDLQTIRSHSRTGSMVQNLGVLHACLCI